MAIAAVAIAGCADPGERADPDEPTASVAQAVVGGTPTTARPDIGILSINCTATLIAPRYVLTAGHCVDYSPTDFLRTSFGIIINNASNNFIINRIHMFGAVASSTFGGNNLPAGDGIGNNDLALIQLTTAVPPNLASPAVLATMPPTGGAASTIYGYGCANRSNPGELSTKRFFTYTYGNATSALCPGDSGGPNLEGFGAQTDAVWGVNSETNGDGHDVFASVSVYKPAILQVIQNWNATTLEVGVDRFGNDFSIFNVGSGGVEACRAACTQNAACRAFTYTSDDGQCFLKNAVSEWVPCARCTSGLAPTMETSTDRFGGDYQGFTLAENRAELCVAACARDVNCQVYTYIPSTQLCILKTAAAAPPSANTCCTSGAPRALEDGYDRPGFDLRRVTFVGGGSPRQCARECAKDARCQAFTYWPDGTRSDVHGGNVCQLKWAQGLATPHAGVTSAARRGLEVNTDRPGADLRNFDLGVASAEACQAECAKDASCQAFTYGPPGWVSTRGHCWLKSGIPGAVRTEHLVSGIKGAEFF